MNSLEPFPLDRAQELADAGYLTIRKHDRLDLWIYNYTAKCAYDRAWNPVTLQCRGLILDGFGNVVARPFPKFFNAEEHSRSDILWKKPFQVFEKVDGSLGILYPAEGSHAIATRGAFHSEQAIRGTLMLHEEMPTFEPDPEYTYLFEIIYPENRVVVDYGGESKLVFLCAIHKTTGANVFKFGDKRDWPGPHATCRDVGEVHPRELSTLETSNAEGFVLYFPHANTRVKVKFEEYKRLHRIVTGTNNKRVWEMLKDNYDFAEILERVPDEFHGWISRVIAGFREEYDKLLTEARRLFAEIDPLSPDRKRFAELANKHRDYAAILFKIKDGQDPSELIWKQIKPDKAEYYAVDES